MRDKRKRDRSPSSGSSMDLEDSMEEVVSYMIEEEYTTSSDTEEHYMRVREERFQEIKNKKKRDRSPSSGSSMDLEE